jgi:hypothetical protein
MNIIFKNYSRIDQCGGWSSSGNLSRIGSIPWSWSNTWSKNWICSGSWILCRVFSKAWSKELYCSMNNID